MLRPLFFKIRSLRGHLARLAWETLRDLMAAAVEEPALRPGMVAVILDRIKAKMAEAGQ